LVCGDVVDGVGCCGVRVDPYWACFNAVDVGRDAEIEIGSWAGNRRAEVVVGVPYLNDRGIVAVDLNNGYGV
jgi:hypothetical protein